MYFISSDAGDSPKNVSDTVHITPLSKKLHGTTIVVDKVPAGPVAWDPAWFRRCSQTYRIQTFVWVFLSGFRSDGRSVPDPCCEMREYLHH